MKFSPPTCPAVALDEGGFIEGSALEIAERLYKISTVRL